MRLVLLGLTLSCAALSAPGGSVSHARQRPPAPAYLTIPYHPTVTCRGGVFHVDGLQQGRYPVKRHPIRPGRHTITIWSRGDCAGYGRLEVTFRSGKEAVLSPRRFR